MEKRAFGKPDDTGKAEVGDERGRGAVGSMATLEVAKAVKKKKME